MREKFGLIGVSLVFAACVPSALPLGAHSEVSGRTAGSGSALAGGESASSFDEPVAKLAARVERGVVRLLVTRPPGETSPSTGEKPQRRTLGEGSGVVLTKDGLVITNAHVVRGSTRIDALAPDGRLLSVTLVAADEPTDLAVLRLGGDLSGIEPLAWSTVELREGERVAVVGNAFGAGLAVSAGVATATGLTGLGYAQYEDFVVTDARVARGTSGGALVNAVGALVGVSTGIFVDGPAGAAFGLAVSERLARPIIEQLALGHPVSRGDLGVDVGDMDLARATELGFGSLDGAVVRSVVAGGPAERAGIAAADVIVQAKDWRVTGRGSFMAALSAVDSGVAVHVTVVRGGKPIDLVMTLGSGGPPPEATGAP
jgi:S1-C subfamily serine protease